MTTGTPTTAPAATASRPQEAACFARIDAAPLNTMLVFDDVALADRYVAHRARAGVTGVICRVDDTRTGSGLVVQWRDPVAAGEMPRRLSEALWLLEEVLAGRVPRPERAAVNDISRQVEERRRAQLEGQA